MNTANNVTTVHKNICTKIWIYTQTTPDDGQHVEGIRSAQESQ